MTINLHTTGSQIMVMHYLHVFMNNTGHLTLVVCKLQVTKLEIIHVCECTHTFVRAHTHTHTQEKRFFRK